MLFAKQKRYIPTILIAITLFLVGSMFLLSRPVKADPVGSLDKNIFYGKTPDVCGAGFQLVHTQTHNGQPFNCLKTGWQNSFKVVPAGADNDCRNNVVVGFPERVAVNSGFGKLCIFMTGDSVQWKQDYQPPAPSVQPGGGGAGSGGSSSAAGGGSSNGGQPNEEPEKQKSAPNESSLGQGDCGDGELELSSGECINAEGRGNDNPIIFYLKRIIQFLSGGVGIVIILMIVISGVQYIASTGNPQATASAKNRLTNAIIALALFLMMFAILNYLVPGGLLSA
jgi:hypothetical protein